MSKRKVQFLEENDETDEGKDSSRRFKAKHSLDSDEEEEGEDESKSKSYNILTEDDVEGQEENTIDHDGEIKITPFNLREEMEDGYFDSEGNYFERKEKEIRDDWLDSVDWVKVKELQTDEASMETSDQFEDANEINTADHLQQMLEILKPKETVLAAIRRLGGKQLSASERLKAKKKKADEKNTQESDKNKEMLLKLTELADGLLNSGEYEIYQATYEKIQHRLKVMKEKAANNDDDDDDALEAAYSSKNPNETKKPTSASKPDEIDNEVYWQYKWDHEKNSQLYGPYSSSEMLEWTSQGYFKDGVLVRKLKDKSAEGEGEFYNSKRIDFDLYT